MKKFPEAVCSGLGSYLPRDISEQIIKDGMKLIFDFLKYCKSVVLVNNLCFRFKMSGH